MLSRKKRRILIIESEACFNFVDLGTRLPLQPSFKKEFNFKAVLILKSFLLSHTVLDYIINLELVFAQRKLENTSGSNFERKFRCYSEQMKTIPLSWCPEMIMEKFYLIRQNNIGHKWRKFLQVTKILSDEMVQS